MRRDPLTRAWAALLVLSAAATAIALALPQLGPRALQGAGVVLLVLAWLKARVILARYLGLSAAPGILRGFGLVLALWMVVAAGLFLAG